VVVIALDPHDDRRVGRAGVDGIVQQVADRLFERVAVGLDPVAGVAEQLHVVGVAVGGDGRSKQRPELDRAGMHLARFALGGDAQQEVVHLADRTLE